MTIHPPPPQISEKNLSQKFGEGKGERYVSKAYDDLARSQCLVELLRSLAGVETGLNKVEAFCSGLGIKFRSKAFKERGARATRGVVAEVMRTKLSDEVRKLDEVTRERDKVRREVKSIYGDESVTTKAIIKHLQISAQRVRAEFRGKYNLKKFHLVRKQEARSRPVACAPANVGEYSEADVYDQTLFDNIKKEEITISKVGKVTVSENEIAALKLHPKFAVREELDEEDIDFQGELCWTKLRYQLLREDEDDEGIGDEADEEVELTDEEKQRFEILEAKSRQFYDPEEKTFNYKKKRVTDVKENARVTLPKAVKELQEVGIEIRRQNLR